MAKSTHTFSISLDFPNHKVDTSRLWDEVQDSDITIALDDIGTVGDACSIVFKAELSTEEEATLASLVAAHSGEPKDPPTTPVQVANPTLKVLALPPEGSKANKISQNWCDRTTWWFSSVAVEDETATTTDPERKVWSVSRQNIIDVFHGKITGENLLADRRVVVVVNGVTKEEQDPHYGTGGDFIVDYAAGTVTFFESVPAGNDPSVSYNYENGSTFIIEPSPGEIWKLKGSEAQFSEDVEINDTMVYEVWAYNPYDPPNKIMVASPDEYRTIYDFINDANKAYPSVPPLGGTGWRGSQQKVQVFAWDFQSTTPLISSYGMELRVRLAHDTPYGGTFATGTFYFLREDE